jgi:hypothetical protein
MKPVRLIKMCVNETYSRVWVGKHLSDMFRIKKGLKKGDALSPLFLNFTLAHTIRKVQAKPVGLKLNGTHQLLVYADDVTILGGSIHTRQKNTDAFVVASNEIGVEVKSEKGKHMVMSQDQHAGKNHNIKFSNKLFERVE